MATACYHCAGRETMQVRIEVYGFLKKIVPQRFRSGPVALEFESPPTVHRILTVVLEIKELDATVLVNGSIVGAGHTIRDGDVIHVFSPIAGG